MDQPLPLAVALEESNPHQEKGQLMCSTPLIRIMTKQLPLTNPLFAAEDESNIINNPTQSRLDQETAQLVLSTPHKPRRRMEDGEMVCAALGERVHVLQENVLPLPVQATMHFGGHHDELVCPSLPRNGGAEMWPCEQTVEEVGINQRGVETAEWSVEDESREGGVVVVSNADIDPGAVVVHLHNTPERSCLE